MDSIEVKAGQRVLLLWSGNTPTEELQSAVETLQKKLGADGKVQVEHIERLTLAQHSNSIFDVAITGLLQPYTTIHTVDVLGEMCRILKPDGEIIVGEPVQGVNSDDSKLRSVEKLNSTLKISGFVNIAQPTVLSLSDDCKQSLMTQFNSSDITLVQVVAYKPSYEVGTSTQLKLSFKNTANSGKSQTKPPTSGGGGGQVWKLSAMDMADDDVDLLDDDELLDKEDLKKPDPSTLKADCGTGDSRPKKACKNCTCGLAEDLEAEITGNKSKQTVTSACGSCYLGDAFRCSSCPYLGMPAFNPGEKIVLSNRQLNADR